MWSDRNSASKSFAKYATLSVLVVDDHAHIRAILLTILNGLGITMVTSAGDANAALEHMAKAPFDLMITDFDMPGMDGFDLVRTIRGDARSVTPRLDPRLPILMITGNITRTLLNSARDAGIDEILAKPFSGVSVAEKLTAALFNRREFVISENYIGPCRRRGAIANYEGPMRRSADFVDLPESEIDFERQNILNEAKSLCNFARMEKRLGLGECETIVAKSIALAGHANRIRNPVIERAAMSLLKFVQVAAQHDLVTPDMIEIHGYSIIELLDVGTRDETTTQRVLAGLEAAVDKRLRPRSAA